MIEVIGFSNCLVDITIDSGLLFADRMFAIHRQPCRSHFIMLRFNSRHTSFLINFHWQIVFALILFDFVSLDLGSFLLFVGKNVPLKYYGR